MACAGKVGKQDRTEWVREDRQSPGWFALRQPSDVQVRLAVALSRSERLAAPLLTSRIGEEAAGHLLARNFFASTHL